MHLKCIFDNRSAYLPQAIAAPREARACLTFPPVLATITKPSTSLPKPTVGTAPKVRPTEYNYTKQMKQGPYKMTMGLEPMKLQDWIEVDSVYEEEMNMRRDVLRDKRHLVIAQKPGAEAACSEMLRMLSEFLPTEYPDFFRKEGSILTALKTGETFDLDNLGMDALEASARLVQEDLCIMEEEDGIIKFTAGAVLFPQRWSLLEKLGSDMHAIHNPVPKYEKEVSHTVDNFMRRLSPPKPFWRANWAITDHPELFQPLTENDIGAMNAGQLREAYTDVTAENAGQTLYTRCERETLMRLPETKAILFTIRTYVRPLAWYAARPTECATLAEALRQLPEDMIRYKTMAHIKCFAQEYLDNAIKV